MNVDEKTRKVVEMYSKYPFPSLGNHGNYFENIVLGPIRELSKQRPIRRLLDAGCGTGNITADIAQRLPEVEITAVDLTEQSLKMAKERAAQEGFKNVTFRRTNLMEFDPELGQFDFVYSQGVIHHLSDPLSGMKNLNRYLKKDHCAFIWLYAILGRRELLDLREALKILGVDKLSWEQRMALTKETRPLFWGARSTYLRRVIRVLDYLDKFGFKGFGHYISQHFLKTVRGTFDDIILADQVLHPQDKFYRFREAYEMFTDSGFEMVKVLEGMSNTMVESFGANSSLAARNDLSRVDAYTLIELHEKPLGFGYLVRKTRDL
jgi:ubiquinone/menaquinone biosynthesis C-methylase UbiE